NGTQHKIRHRWHSAPCPRRLGGGQGIPLVDGRDGAPIPPCGLERAISPADGVLETVRRPRELIGEGASPARRGRAGRHDRDTTTRTGRQLLRRAALQTGWLRWCG